MLSSELPAGWRFVGYAQRLVLLPLWIVPLFYASIGAILWTGGGTDLVSSAFVVIVFAGWIFSIMQFSKSAEHQPRWWVPVLEYHIVALLMIPCFRWFMGGVSAITTWTVDWMSMAWLFFALVVSFVCLLLYGDARRRVAHLKIVRC
ncbi:MAG: hypothetical protein GXP29_05595 [Planctomycetes bacterium]|nr:hypothetical protein [Planctomycetota bacterium]